MSPLLVEKLTQYAEILDTMDSSNGRYPFPDHVIEYFEKLGVVHWAELYTFSGKAKFVSDKKNEIAEGFKLFSDAIGDNPTLENIEKFLNNFMKEVATSKDTFPGLEFLELAPNPDFLTNYPDEELTRQKDVLIGFLVNFYNDLAVAAHKETIFSLIFKAENNDHESLNKAIQIDPTIVHYFNKVLTKTSLKGNANYFDNLAYRIKNSPRKGANKHPLLWILLKDLHTFKCLHKGIKSHQILTLYQQAVGDYPKFYIDDEQIVQRQRRQFNPMYR